MTPAILLETVSFAYPAYPAGHAVLSGVDLAVEAGEMTGLIGPNGAGKTTLIGIMAGVLLPTAGRVTIGGVEPRLARRRELARQLAVVHQEHEQAFPFTVGEIVAMGRWPRLGGLGVLGAADRRAVDAALERTAVAAFRHRRLDELSGGERQRVYLARALAQETELLLLDEPVAHLDVLHQLAIMELLGGLIAEGRTVLLALHDLSLAARYCGRLAMLLDGRLAATGSPQDVCNPSRLAAVFGVESSVDTNPLTGRPRISWGNPDPARREPAPPPCG